MHWFTRIFRLHATLWLGLAVMLAVFWIASEWRNSMQLATGWNAGIATFLGLTLVQALRRRSAEDIEHRAGTLDQAGAFLLPLSILSGAASLFVVIAETSATERPSLASVPYTVLTILISWLFVHVIFALHYAHEYYAPGEDGVRGGLEFAGDEAPDYWDFLHLALSVGVANQGTVAASSRRIRRVLTLHGLISWLFNTIILALTINLVINLF
ncbi:MAG TPA: DUF1345 domain-containing protein [Brevundimonas sp.]|nr:DUF1345 domain-containing protein [Brevundimonas sp.]